jgi:hypothetical protein
VASALVGLGFAAFSATKAVVSYSDACVLHKAWKIAKSRGRNFFTESEIIESKNELVLEYKAPKLQSEHEIRDSLLSLCGLKAIERSSSRYNLKEHIVFFSNGGIMN